MKLINVDGLLPKDTYMATFNMDASSVPLAQEPPDGGAPMAQPSNNPPPQRSPPIPGKNSVATKAINEAAATTPEGMANWITEMLTTFKDLFTN